MPAETGSWREELRRDYQQTLPEKLRLLGELYRAFALAPGDQAALEALVAAVHRLHGSAGSYGFRDVSRVAGEWELELAQAKGAGLPADEAARMAARLESLRALVEAAVPRGTGAAELEASDALIAGLRAALGRDPRVLLVEDDEDMAALLTATLQAQQIGCTAAASVTEALATFETGFDLVVTDYRVAGGTAKALVRELRLRDSELPILVISGQVDKRELVDIIRESVDEFHEKPIDTPAFLGGVARLLVLGEERRRTKRRGAALLRLSSQLRLGMAGKDLLDLLVTAVPEITPFRSASVSLLGEDRRTLTVAATHGQWPGDTPETQPVEEVRARHARGLRLDAAALVLSRATDGARYGPWRAGDQILVELSSAERLWGYLAVDSPLDGRRPSDDSLRMLALLGHQIAAALENEEVYSAQMRLNFQLRFARELVRTALDTRDVEQLKPLLTSAAVNGLGGSFAAFVEHTPRGPRLSDIACKRTEDYLENLAVTPQGEAVFARVARTGAPVHWRADEGAVSLVGRQRAQAVLALPIREGDTLRYLLLVEEDDGGAFDDASVRAYGGLADQIGLILSRLHYQRYLETTGTELRESYSKLQAAHADILRLQGLLKRYLPPSTWKALLDNVAGGPLPAVEALVEAGVMFVRVAGFEVLAESLPAARQVDLLNRVLNSVVPIVVGEGGEVIKYVGDGVMARFASRAETLAAALALIECQSGLNVELGGRGLPVVKLRVGAAFGPCVVGHVGPQELYERTLVGEPVLSAARLEREARPGSALLDARLLPANRLPAEHGLAPLPGPRRRGDGQPLEVLTPAAHLGWY